MISSWCYGPTLTDAREVVKVRWPELCTVSRLGKGGSRRLRLNRTDEIASSLRSSQ